MFAALALVGALLVNGVHAEATAPVRYAGLTSCPGKDGKRHICGPWRLWLRDGRTITLPDAQLRSLGTDGREERLRAPISVDAYGRFATYFSKSTHKLVVRDISTGKTTNVAERPSVAMSSLELLVSPGGRYVVIDPDTGSSPTTVVESATGKRWSLPDYARVQGFSPDGKLLRVILDYEETAVYRPGGAEPSGGVTLVGWGALTNDGRTLAGASRTHIRFYSTANAMESRRALRIALPAKQSPRRLDWTSATGLTMLTLQEPRRFVARSINTRTGAVRITDAFTISDHTWDVHLAGE
ncbi:hypothetical protein ACIBG8_27075 [Nonomuraea sp. NPDC050556]|uniref:hypothetical protein n=1 Tax=Nonomuraea sp. NPDC050556 TaxID=3364369 RepID=UPI003790B5C8